MIDRSDNITVARKIFREKRILRAPSPPSMIEK
jgi:hypothetical protein